MRRPLILGLLALLVLLAAAGYGGWRTDLRWRPRTLARHGREIAALLDGSGWVSPGPTPQGKVLYVLSFRACPDCIRFEQEEFPRLHAAGVETRVVLYPRRRVSDAPERAGVAELWANRDWRTYQRWMSAVPAAWTAEGVASAETGPRAALVERSRRLVEALAPLMRDNGVRLATPLLVWRDARGRLRGCACEKRETYRFVRGELGAS